MLLICPDEVKITLEDDKTTTVVDYTTDSSDTVSMVSASYSTSPGSDLTEGTTSVSCTATDAKENFAECEFGINVASAVRYNANRSGGFVGFHLAILLLLSILRVITQ